MSNVWAQPKEVSGADVAFGVGAVDALMPPMSEIPEEFRNLNSRSKWSKLQSDWFFNGLRNAQWTPREGIETQAALRHLKAIQGSFEPSHEHKAAAVSYLASLWFEDVTYEVAS